MKAWFLGLPQPARVVAALVALLLALALWLVLSAFAEALLNGVGTIADNQPRIARLAGYAQRETQLRDTVDKLAQTTAQLGYAAELETSQAGAQLQQQLRGFAERAGLTVRGSQLDQVLADAESGRVFDTLTVELNMTGEPVAVDDFLTSVHTAEPLMVVERLTLTKPRVTAREQRRRRQAGQANEQALAILARITAAKLVAP